jgi:trigger factor
VELPVAMEDLLNVTVKGWAEGKEILNMERADFIPRPDARVPAPGFSERLIGMAAYETKDFIIEVPDDFEYSEIAGKNCQFEVLIHIVKRKAPEALTDEFAKGAGTGYESLSDMRAKIKAGFLQSEERLIDSRHQDDALEQLQNKAKFEMSPLIVEHEVEHLIEDHQEALQTGRMSVEIYQQYLQWAGKTADEIREAARPNAASRVKRSLILEKLTEENDLAVSDAELNSEIERLAIENSTEQDKVRELFQDPERIASLNRLLLNRKALSFLSDLTANTSKISTGKQATIKKKSDKDAPKIQAKKRGTK